MNSCWKDLMLGWSVKCQVDRLELRHWWDSSTFWVFFAGGAPQTDDTIPFEFHGQQSPVLISWGANLRRFSFVGHKLTAVSSAINCVLSHNINCVFSHKESACNFYKSLQPKNKERVFNQRKSLHPKKEPSISQKVGSALVIWVQLIRFSSTAHNIIACKPGFLDG